MSPNVTQGRGGVKIVQKICHILFEWPLISRSYFFFLFLCRLLCAPRFSCSFTMQTEQVLVQPRRSERPSTFLRNPDWPWLSTSSSGWANWRRRWSSTLVVTGSKTVLVDISFSVDCTLCDHGYCYHSVYMIKLTKSQFTQNLHHVCINPFVII